MSWGSHWSRRRRWLLAAVAGIGLAAVAGVLLWHQIFAPAADREWQRRIEERLGGPPNLILITIDTLRADRLSSYGYNGLATPHIDRLAREGVRFTNAASTIPFTLPAHSSIMTGTYPPYHGVRENVGYALDASLVTLAERLGEAGYTTAGFVSAFVLDARWGIAQGFGHYDDAFGDAPAGQRLNMASVQRLGGDTAAAAIRWLEEGPPAPFFLWIHLFDPHDPYAPPEPYRARYRRRPYDGEVAYTDSVIGKLVRAMERARLLERSVVVLTGDHGEGLGDHAEAFHGFFVYDPTVRVPLILRLPGAAYGGRSVRSAVSHVDLVPTLLEAAGLAAPASLQGRSLLPLLFARPVDAWGGVYSESTYPRAHYGWAPLTALRTERFKLIEAPRPELYDLIADPREQHDLMAEQPDVARRLRRRLHELASRLERPRAGSARPDLDADTLRRLQALGYVAGRGEVTGEGTADRARADPKDKIRIHQRIMRAQSDLGQGGHETARRRLEQVLEEDAAVLDAHQMLGVVAGEQGRPAEAVEHFQHALALDADHTQSLFGLATSYRRLGRLDEALVGYRRLLALAPHDSKAALAMAEILVEQNRLEEALAAVVEAAGSPEAPALVHNQHGELLVLVGRSGQAAAFRRALQQNPDLAQPYFNLAVLAEERGDGAAAMRLYGETLARAPHHYRAQFNLGRLLGERGERNRQRRLYEAAIASNPDFVDGYYYLAKLLMDSGDGLARAEELVRDGLAREREGGEGPFGHYLLADILNRQGRPAEAMAAARRGRQIEGELRR